MTLADNDEKVLCDFWNADLGAMQSKMLPLSTSAVTNEKNIVELNTSRMAFVWNHQLSPSTYYSLRGSYYDYNREMRVRRFVN